MSSEDDEYDYDYDYEYDYNDIYSNTEDFEEYVPHQFLKWLLVERIMIFLVTLFYSIVFLVTGLHNTPAIIKPALIVYGLYNALLLLWSIVSALRIKFGFTKTLLPKVFSFLAIIMLLFVTIGFIGIARYDSLFEGSLLMIIAKWYPAAMLAIFVLRSILLLYWRKQKIRINGIDILVGYDPPIDLATLSNIESIPLYSITFDDNGKYQIIFESSETLVDNQDECVICRCNYEDGDTIRHLKCGHYYHQDCSDPWLLYRESCPLCRSPV